MNRSKLKGTLPLGLVKRMRREDVDISIVTHFGRLTYCARPASGFSWQTTFSPHIVEGSSAPLYDSDSVHLLINIQKIGVKRHEVPPVLSPSPISLGDIYLDNGVVINSVRAYWSVDAPEMCYALSCTIKAFPWEVLVRITEHDMITQTDPAFIVDEIRRSVDSAAAGLVPVTG